MNKNDLNITNKSYVFCVLGYEPVILKKIYRVSSTLLDVLKI